MTGVYEASAGGVQVLHAIATADTALTAREIADRLDGATVDTTQATLTKLYRAGYVVWRERETSGFGGNPREYAVYEPDGDSL